ncbi:MAG: hypothetical protein GYA55_08325 [SAR324 cluster bacterium]|uniref:Uncharacterized protein n=1 Tax=SAR324 cluster bacterium TaxID=2024889 RepID=A0A7X9FSM7_9DELT|nr:hypothetical protein [SAR324 cluster bacterium]
MRGFFLHHSLEAKDLNGSNSVCILFEDPAIKKIFAQLIASRGFQPKEINDIEEIIPNSKVISEANYFIHLDRETQNRCLVVGDNTAITNLAPVSLTRPLTEEKVEAALEEFFKL